MPKLKPATHQRIISITYGLCRKITRITQLDPLNLEENMKEASLWITIVLAFRLHIKENLVAISNKRIV